MRDYVRAMAKDMLQRKKAETVRIFGFAEGVAKIPAQI